MNRGTSLYLDLVRFSAAMLVFFGHLSNPFFTGGFLGFLAPWMDEAVIVFFVLSGFVIAHVTHDRIVTPADYAVARMARIYSVALPALVTAVALDMLGRAIDPQHYLNDPGYHADGLLLQFALAPFFLNQLWYIDVPVGSMSPYWSLCFEVWYYIAFGLLHFLPSPMRWIALGLLGLFVGPIIAAYGLFWALGVLAYRLCRVPMREALGLLLCLGGAAVVITAAAYRVPGEAEMQVLLAPVLGGAGFWHDGVIALGFAAHLTGFSAVAHRVAPLLGAIERPLRWFAGATFTVYLFHLPIAHVIRVLLPVPHDSALGRLILLGGTFLVLLAIAQVTERRKSGWQHLFAALIAWGQRWCAVFAARRDAAATPPR